MTDNRAPDTDLAAPVSEDLAPRHGFWERALPSEETVLKLLFAGALVGAVSVAVLDLKTLAEQTAALEAPGLPPGGGAAPSGPRVTAPPAQDDHLRPFFPGAPPRRPDGAAPALPGAPEGADVALTEPMRFLRGPGGAATAVGRIDRGAAAALNGFLEAQAGEVMTLHLHSPGGIVQEALALTRVIRDAGLVTVVSDDALCASSCPLLLAAGVERKAARGAFVGLHRVYPAPPDEQTAAFSPLASAGALAEGVSQGQAVTAEILARLEALGVDPAIWIHALQTPSDRIYYLTSDQMRETGLATEILDAGHR